MRSKKNSTLIDARKKKKKNHFAFLEVKSRCPSRQSTCAPRRLLVHIPPDQARKFASSCPEGFGPKGVDKLQLPADWRAPRFPSHPSLVFEVEPTLAHRRASLSALLRVTKYEREVDFSAHRSKGCRDRGKG